jgi:hypothetical protein
MVERAGAQEQDKLKSSVKPVRKSVGRKQLVSICQGTADRESTEDHSTGRGLFGQRPAVRRVPADTASPAQIQPQAGTESRFAHDFSRIRAHTVAPPIGLAVSDQPTVIPPGSRVLNRGPQIQREGASDEGDSAAKPHRAPADIQREDEGAAAEATGDTSITLTYSSSADSSVITDYVEGVIKDVLKAAGENSATITSTTRTAADQARVMYNNLEKHGEAHQKKLYGSAGDKVIDVWVTEKKAGKSEAEIKSAMESKINELGPSKVSRHCGDPTKKVAVDIDPSSVKDSAKVVKAAQAESRVSKVIPPPADPAIHLEIPVK